MTHAIVLAEADLGPEPPSFESAYARPFRFTIPVVLAAGWGALIAFSLMFLMDEATVQTASAAQDRGASVVEPASYDNSGEASRALGTGVTEAGAATIATDAKGEATAAIRTVAIAAVTTPDAALRADRSSFERPDYAGTWGPNAAACGSKSRRRGFLPATITEDGAKAGRVSCHFRDSRRDGSAAWAMTADCVDRGRRWTSQVRLSVEGDRLTWRSAKGPAIYIRCGRRDG